MKNKFSRIVMSYRRKEFFVMKKITVCTAILTLLICMSVSASAGAEKLIELNYDNFNGALSDAGVVNVGTSKTAVVNFGSSVHVKMEKNEIFNTNLQKVIQIYKHHDKYNWVSVGSNMSITDVALQENDVTFEFWTDLYTPTDSDAGRCIAEYRVEYKNGSTTENALFRLCQINYESQNNYAWNIGYDGSNTINMADSKGWTHVAITKHKADADGNVKMNLFINGVYKKSKTLNIPKGATINSVQLTFGGTFDNKMVPTNSYYSNIIAHKGILLAAEIADLYKSQTNIFEEFKGEVSFGVYNQDEIELQKSIGIIDWIKGVNAKIHIDNTDLTDDMNTNIYAAVYNGMELESAGISDLIEVAPGQTGVEATVPLSEIIDASLNDEVFVYMWTDELVPLMEKKSFYIKDAFVSETGECRLILHTDIALRADSIVPDAFTVTDEFGEYKVKNSVYYPLTHELHLILKDADGLAAPCRVQANLLSADGNPVVVDEQPGISLLMKSAIDGDDVKYTALYKDGVPVCNVYEEGRYNVEIGVVLLSEVSSQKTVNIVVYKLSGDKKIEVGRKKGSMSADDIRFNVECDLKPFDKLLVEIK